MTTESDTPSLPKPANLLRLFGKIDVYLFDQFLKGRFQPGMKVLDAGCGDGRNLVYFMRTGFQVFGVDRSHEALQAVRTLAARVSPSSPETNFRPDMVESLSFEDAAFDVVLSNAVLHFARGTEHFDAMVGEMARVLRPGGIFFARLMTTMGLEGKTEDLGEGRHRLPAGQEMFLATREQIHAATERMGAELLEPVKSVLVEEARSMGVWVARKKE
ncbi:MAG: tellurite methyltransferase [Candidatus Sumerlaeota bacterium]|nr:tellurite methyltransferase [Candidatus Sumerlaeota bacterium]